MLGHFTFLNTILSIPKVLLWRWTVLAWDQKLITISHLKIPTVNLEMFMRVLFSLNCRCQIPENKTLAKWGNHFVVYWCTKISPSHNFLPQQICLLTLITKIKFSYKFPYLHFVFTMQTKCAVIRPMVSQSSNEAFGGFSSFPWCWIFCRTIHM